MTEKEREVEREKFERTKFNKVFYLNCAVTAIGFIYIFLITFIPLEPQNKEIALMVLGFVTGTVLTTIIIFYTGGSPDKNKQNENNKNNRTIR